MILNNEHIYTYSQNFEIFKYCDIKMPIKINFYLQKNIKTIMDAAQEIDGARFIIAQQYGTLNEEGTGFNIPQENIEIVNKELNDLLSLEQDLNIHTFKLDDFNDLELTYQQMSAIMFMIEEE